MGYRAKIRRLAWTGCAACLALGSLGTAALADPVPVDLPFTYTCAFGSIGDLPVTVDIRATLPKTGVTGTAIQPTEAVAEVTLPAATLAALHPPGITGAEGSVNAMVLVGQNGKVAEAPWSDLTAEPAKAGESGDLVFAATGEVPPVTPTAEGDLVFEAGGLQLNLLFRTADGTPAPLDATQFACAPDPGQDLTIATMPISGTPSVPPSSTLPSTPSSQTPSSTPENPAAAVEPGTPIVAFKVPGNGPTPEYVIAEPDPPPELPTGVGVVRTRLQVEAEVAKQNHTVKFHPGVNYAYELHLDPVDYLADNHVPATEDTLLLYGFLPVTSTPKITETARGIVDTGDENSAKATVTQKIDIGGVKVNGVPLDVGKKCGTGEFQAVLHNVGPWLPFDGGVLQGEATLPPFENCGVAEDLDPILTGQLSGPGNTTTATTNEGCLMGPLPKHEWCSDVIRDLSWTSSFSTLGPVSGILQTARVWPSPVKVGTPVSTRTAGSFTNFGPEVTKFLRDAKATTVSDAANPLAGPAITGTVEAVAENGIVSQLPISSKAGRVTLPAVGTGFDLGADTGIAVQMSSLPAGKYQIRLTSLKITMTPRDAQRRPTALGTFDVALNFAPGQERQFMTVKYY